MIGSMRKNNRTARAATTPKINDMIGSMRKTNRAARATTTPKINDIIGSMRKNNRAARAARTVAHLGSLSKHDIDGSENVV